MTNITLAQAEAVLQAAKAKAIDKGYKMNISIVDIGANLVAFLRMDEAWLGSIDVAHKKAKTAIFFQMNTEALSPMVQPGKPLYAIEHSNDGLITFGGGVVLKDGDTIIGAIGVSGGMVDQDQKVAEAGADAL